MDFIDYREKLGIGFCDKEQVNYFFTKVFNLFDGMNHDYMHDQIDNPNILSFVIQPELQWYTEESIQEDII